MDVKRFELIEVPVIQGVTGRVTFPSVPQLRNQANQIILIKNIVVFDDLDMNTSTDGAPILPSDETGKLNLVFYVNGEESLHMMPVPLLMQTRIDGAGTTPLTKMSNSQILNFDNLSNVDFDKSYLFVNTALSSDCTVPIGVNYVRLMRNPDNTFAVV